MPKLDCVNSPSRTGTEAPAVHRSRGDAARTCRSRCPRHCRRRAPPRRHTRARSDRRRACARSHAPSCCRSGWRQGWYLWHPSTGCDFCDRRKSNSCCCVTPGSTVTYASDSLKSTMRRMRPRSRTTLPSEAGTREPYPQFKPVLIGIYRNPEARQRRGRTPAPRHDCRVGRPAGHARWSETSPFPPQPGARHRRSHARGRRCLQILRSAFGAIRTGPTEDIRMPQAGTASPRSYARQRRHRQGRRPGRAPLDGSRARGRARARRQAC